MRNPSYVPGKVVSGSFQDRMNSLGTIVDTPMKSHINVRNAVDASPDLTT